MRSDRNHLIENRHIRMFLSSTFQDLQDERDYLMKRTFPELRKVAAERDVTLTELDLRWGITEEEAQDGKVVEICLREIENSIPFFIGIIGNRYGWCPSFEDVNDSVIERYEKVGNYISRHLSVTEMEMQFGVLERPENINAFFYISKNEESIEKTDNFQKLQLLKESIINNNRYPVSFFSSKEDLSNQIKESFLLLLNSLFPERNLSFLEKFRLGQNSFKNQLCQTYVPDERVFKNLDAWLEDWNSNTMVITGESGIGKSAFIANWIDRTVHRATDDYEIVFIFIGTGGSESNEETIRTIICSEIRDKFDIQQSDSGIEGETDISKLFQRISEIDKKLVLILDGINQISSAKGKNLNWLPFPPKNVKILLSTLNDDSTMEILNARRYLSLELKPLDKQKRTNAIESYLGKYAKRLSAKQIDKILNSPVCINTLVLRTLLDELVNFGIYERIDEKIDYYINSGTIKDFYKLLLTSYESEFGYNFVKNALVTIAISQNGLTENELLNINGISALHWSQFYCSFMRNFNFSEGKITFSHQYLSSAVHDKYSLDSDSIKYRKLVYKWFVDNPCNHSITEIPYQLFKSDENDKLYDFLSDYTVFSHLFSYDNNSLRNYWNRLTQLNPKKYSLDIYRDLDSGECDRRTFANSLNQIGFFVGKNYSKYDLALFCHEKALKIRKVVLGEHNLDTAISYNNLGTVNLELGKYEESIKMYQKALSIRKELFGELSPDVATTYNNIGTVYERFDSTQAIFYLEKALDIRRQIYGEYSTEVAISYNNIASVYLHPDLRVGELTRAKLYMESAIDIQLGMVGEDNENTASFYNALSLVYTYLHDYKSAIFYCQKSIDINSKLFVEGHPSFSHNYLTMGGIYSMQHDYSRSNMLFEKALSIRLKLYGENDCRVADIYVLLADNYSQIGETKKSLMYFLKAAHIYSLSQNDSAERKSSITEIYNEIGFSYYLLGDYDNAINYYNQALDIQLDLQSRNLQNSGFVAILINNIARAYFKKGDLEVAFAKQSQALKLQLEIYGENNVDVARSYNNIGLIYTERNLFDKALEYLTRGLNIRKELDGDNRLDIADSNNNLGDLFYRQGSKVKALEYYSVAYDTYVNIFGRHNEKSREVFEKILKAKLQ